MDNTQRFSYKGAIARTPLHLRRTLSSLETWGFGLTGHVTWLSIAPALNAALGASAIFVLLPAVIIGTLINLQVKRLGEHWPDMAGGTPNYTARMLKNYPGIAKYAAIGYFFSWVSNVPISAIILTALIKQNLEPLGIACPVTILQVGFVTLTYIVAFSGTRALSILHLFFVIPSMGLLLAFCLQGVGWLAVSPDSPGFFPTSWPHLTFTDWTKWFFFATYATYACESASAFVGDSRRPNETLRFLNFAAVLIPPVFLGGSLVLMRLATDSGIGDDTFLNLLTASKPFWNSWAALIVTFLIAASCLLSCATAVSNCPRILYQLASDGHLAPVFAVVSQRGVLGPALVLTLCFNLVCLAWGDLARIVVVTNVGWVVCFMTFHLGLWLRRSRSEVRWPWWSLFFFLLEAVALVFGGWAWGWQDFLLGLLFPLAILGVDACMRRIAFGPFHPAWWIARYRTRRQGKVLDFVAVQVVVLLFLVCGSVVVGWVSGIRFHANFSTSSNLLMMLLLCIAFIGVAIACWTSLPQAISMGEAREAAEHLFTIALDAILVLNETGAIRQANPAAEDIFGVRSTQLIGRHLHELLPGLQNEPERWPNRSEQTLNQEHKSSRILEVAISDRFSFRDSTLWEGIYDTPTNQNLQEYVVILRDITERKQTELALQQANEELEIKVKGRTTELRHTVEQLQMEIVERQRVEGNLRAMQNQIIVQEKLASLGSLTAGIAHEIRNPLNFVNNFSELSIELMQELFEEIESQNSRLEPQTQEYITDILNDLKQNVNKINEHGRRADSIVGSMLLHARGEGGNWEATDINSLLAEYINLAYHGMRAKAPHFNVKLETEYDDSIQQVEIIRQDIGRVFLNIINNACYAVFEKQNEMGEGFLPSISVKTKNLGERIEISIRDNGKGMTQEVINKIFNPFFTTKPTGEGTGLGLSLSYDIVVHQHRGELRVESEAGSYAEFIVVLLKKIRFS